MGGMGGCNDVAFFFLSETDRVKSVTFVSNQFPTSSITVGWGVFMYDESVDILLE